MFPDTRFGITDASDTLVRGDWVLLLNMVVTIMVLMDGDSNDLGDNEFMMAMIGDES